MKKSEIFTIVAGVAFVAVILWVSGVFKSNADYVSKEISNNTNNTNNMAAIAQVSGTNVSTDPKLQMIDVQVGTGALATAGKTISVNYTGMLADGTVFDSSYKRNQAFEFKLGDGMVIAGWEKGFAGMKVGGKRRLVISPEYGYGASGIPGAIPANATLYFDVELMGVK